MVGAAMMTGYVGSLQSAMVGPSSATGGRRYYYARVGWRDRWCGTEREKNSISETVREVAERYIVKWWLIWRKGIYRIVSKGSSTASVSED